MQMNEAKVHRVSTPSDEDTSRLDPIHLRKTHHPITPIPPAPSTEAAFRHLYSKRLGTRHARQNPQKYHVLCRWNAPIADATHMLQSSVVLSGFQIFLRRASLAPTYMPALLALSTTLSERLISSWQRQRFVAASSRRTDENVASRSGSGKHCRRASRARALSLKLFSVVSTVIH